MKHTEHSPAKATKVERLYLCPSCGTKIPLRANGLTPDRCPHCQASTSNSARESSSVVLALFYAAAGGAAVLLFFVFIGALIWLRLATRDTTTGGLATTEESTTASPVLHNHEQRRIGPLNWGVTSLAFSPDAKMIAVGKLDNIVLQFDIATGTLLAKQEGLTNLGQITCCAYSPDGKRLLTGGYTGRIVVWDVEQGKLERSGHFSGHTDPIKTIAMSADGESVLSGGQGKVLRYWRLNNFKELGAWEMQSTVLDCQILASGDQALATDGISLARINLPDVTIKENLPLGSGGALSAAISPDEQHVVFTDAYDLRVWNIRTGEEVVRLKDRETQWSVRFSPDGRRVIAGGNGKVNVWDPVGRQRVYSLDTAGIGYSQSIAFASDNQTIAGLGKSSRVISIFQIPGADE